MFVLHMDVDAFFVQAEQLKHPSIQVGMPSEHHWFALRAQAAVLAAARRPAATHPPATPNDLDTCRRARRWRSSSTRTSLRPTTPPSAQASPSTWRLLRCVTAGVARAPAVPVGGMPVPLPCAAATAPPPSPLTSAILQARRLLKAVGGTVVHVHLAPGGRVSYQPYR